MLFNSFEFLFAFLPVTLIGFHLLNVYVERRAAIAWLVAASLFYYAWWNFAFVALIVFSILFNFALGGWLARHHGARAKSMLAFGVVANLAVLGYFKYANFFLDNLNLAFGTGYNFAHIVLPIGISFFTFQQIAFLVDAYRSETQEYDLLNYALFVSFFPQLIAGPIVHHKEMLPQFDAPGTRTLHADTLGLGITVFILGLAKKVVIADQIARYSTQVFKAVELGLEPNFREAWGAALAYTFQLYFDFSGYSDMAIGLALMFGIRLPQNFNSPYKARNIIDFWRRWHMTLSRFLRDYLYIPLGGNRKGSARRYVNVMITMVLGGLWHGAAWTFVAWGALHGVLLVLNMLWRGTKTAWGWPEARFGVLGTFAARAVTFILVVIAWVFFRAESFAGAWAVLHGMFGLNGLGEAHTPYFEGSKQVVRLALLFLAAWFLPNLQQLFAAYRPVVEDVGPAPRWAQRIALTWAPSLRWAVATSILVLVVYGFMVKRTTEFLYYQF